MNKKVLATILGCFAVATIILTGVFYLGGSDSDSNVIDLNEAEYSAASNVSNEEENVEAGETVGTEESDASTGEAAEAQTEDTTEAGNTVAETEEETENLHGLSTEANAVVNSLDFNESSSLLWPIEGDILLDFSVENTIYFPTLNEYKTNPAIVIQADVDLPVVAAATGVVSEIGEDNEIGVYMKMLIGNDYELTYGQIINPLFEVGETVEEGSIIGYITDPTKYYVTEGYNLYFKVTQADEPVDPLDYLSYD